MFKWLNYTLRCGALLLLAYAFPVSAAAQCHTCQNGGDADAGVWHWDDCDANPFLGFTGTCNEGSHAGDCEFSHTFWMCGPGDAAAVVDSVFDSVEREDVLGLLGHVNQYATVEINWERKALQIRGCDGKSVIAQVALPRTLWYALDRKAGDRARRVATLLVGS